MRPRRTLTLNAGTVLYHGVRRDEADGDHVPGPDEDAEDDLYPPDEITLPAWFSRDINVARQFARRGPVRTYRLEEAIQVVLITSRAELDDVLLEHDLGVGTPEDIIGGLPADFPGWIIPDNYGPGAEDLLLGHNAQLSAQEE